MRKIMIGLLVLAMFLTACNSQGGDGDDPTTPTGLTLEDIKTKVLDASLSMKTYSFDLKMDMDMTVKAGGLEMDMTYTMAADGKLDRDAKKLEMVGLTEIEMMGSKESMDMSTYIVDDYVYTQVMDQWMKISMEGEDVWGEQDQIEQVMELIESGTIERLDDESMNGQNYYVLKINPDLELLTKRAMQQQGSTDFGPDVNFEDIVKEYEEKVWVNKETFVIEKSQSDITMEMTPENLGIDDGSSGQIDAKVSTEVMISNINQPVTITLPAAAADAQEMPDMTEGTLGTGNVVSEVFG